MADDAHARPWDVGGVEGTPGACVANTRERGSQPEQVSSDVTLKWLHVLRYMEVLEKEDGPKGYEELMGSIDLCDSAATKFCGLVKRAADTYSPLEAEKTAAAAAEKLDGLDWERIQADEEVLRLRGLRALISERIEEHSSERLRVPRSLDLSDFADGEQLRELAEAGARVLTPEGFKPCSESRGLRDKYQRLGPAPGVLLRREQETCDALLIKVPLLKEFCLAEGLPLHLSDFHWVRKVDDPLGRPIFDYSNNVQTPLNADGAVEAYEQVYGKLKHPSIKDVIRLIADGAYQWGWAELHLAKKDISRAFRRWRYKVEQCTLLAVQVQDNLGLVPLGGVFGHCGSPHVQGVVSRFVCHLHRKRAMESHGRAFMVCYVDDLIFVAPRAVLEPELSAVGAELEAFVGEGADALHKQQGPARTMDILGWRVDLDNGVMQLPERALVKMIYVLWVALPWDLTQVVSVKAIQSAAGVVARYAEVFPGTRPFQWALFHQRVIGPRVRLSKRAIQDLWFWRALTLATSLQPLDGVPLLAPLCAEDPERVPTHWRRRDVFVDACKSKDLVAVGVFVPSIDHEAGAWVFLEWGHDLSVAVPTPHINTLELLGVCLGFLLTRQLFPTTLAVRVFTDNTSAQAWADPRASAPKQCLPFTYSLMCLAAFSQVLPSFCMLLPQRISSSENEVADSISRGRFFRVGHSRSTACSRMEVSSALKEWLVRAAAEGDSSGPLSRGVRDLLTKLAGADSWPFFTQWEGVERHRESPEANKKQRRGC